MKTLNKIKPYTDDDLVWNEKTKKYELTLQYCKENFDNNYVDDATLQKRIKENSNLIYRFIKYRVASFNRRIVDNVINLTKEGREFILEMLSTQMSADIETGFNDLGKQPAINLANGQIIDRNQMFANQVSIETEQVFDSSDSYFGFRIGYQAPFPYIYFVYFK